MILLIDMDDVLADFEGDFIRRWKKSYPDKRHVELQDRRGFSMMRQYPEELRELAKQIYTDKNFCRELSMIEGSLDAIREIEKMENIDAFICSAPLFPSYQNSTLDKFNWVKNNLGEHWVNKLILTYDKTVIAGDYLIDDNPEIKGSAIPKWEHIVFDQPYNRDSKTEKRLTWKNWKEILQL